MTEAGRMGWRNRVGVRRRNVGVGRRYVGANRRYVGVNRRYVRVGRRCIGANRRYIGVGRRCVGVGMDVTLWVSQGCYVLFYIRGLCYRFFLYYILISSKSNI